MKGGTEFLFWILFAVIIWSGCAVSGYRERRRSRNRYATRSTLRERHKGDLWITSGGRH
jgi:cbb3-type cytochrome oxidase subunit 3